MPRFLGFKGERIPYIYIYSSFGGSDWMTNANYSESKKSPRWMESKPVLASSSFCRKDNIKDDNPRESGGREVMLNATGDEVGRVSCDAIFIGPLSAKERRNPFLEPLEFSAE
jgi:hypothetical protein